MANLKDIRTRIKSVKSTRQITSAMKMVSAAKLRKAQNRVEQLRPYAEKLQQILSHVSKSMSGNKDFIFIKERPVKKVLMVIITSNKGLCGSFNSKVIKQSLAFIKEKYSDTEIEVFTIGKKANDMMKKQPYKIVRSETDIFDNLSFDSVSAFADQYMSWFAEGTYDKIFTVYNSFINTVTQEVKTEQYLPMVLESDEENDETYDYIFEPDKDAITKELIPKSLRTQLFKDLIDSFAAEHGARMTAMHQATDNATELLEEITLQYNKARQAAITSELLEITSGADALKG
ncbi:MAG: ATP synthase F1 subunit gamma [Bacteroidota bacterium]|nr:ATP synthase F1 subunit gamma [Bacteroidota bacterium]